MTDDVQLDDAAAALLETARQVVPSWLRRTTEAASRRGGLDPVAIEPELRRMADDASADVLFRLADLLATDVDAQRTTPLSLFRGAVAAPTAFLRAHGVRPPAPAAGDHGFADDAYGLGPATWSDVDPALHEPGLRWGASKAMTVLARRRDEGVR